MVVQREEEEKIEEEKEEKKVIKGQDEIQINEEMGGRFEIVLKEKKEKIGNYESMEGMREKGDEKKKIYMRGKDEKKKIGFELKRRKGGE